MFDKRVGRLYGESADDYEESADGYIPTGASGDSELESADCSADSNADASKVGVWVWALTLCQALLTWSRAPCSVPRAVVGGGPLSRLLLGRDTSEGEM